MQLRTFGRTGMQLSVLGFDDIDMAQWETFNLTTVRQPIAEMAQIAVRLLHERIKDPRRKPRHRSLEASSRSPVS